uniref:probable leucine-rich repeat receptor-like protein kinase At1g35710 n=1 Tax=Fragaria vesca subsp. vesca TaxID=101020 RepID=UPI0005C89CC6|nr:PREDICTED: probable leucine-rich repeat receptor-like protein kinase At1g35710 [Fragaria vesca subsp. vesca]
MTKAMRSTSIDNIAPLVFCLFLYFHIPSSLNYIPHFASASSTTEAEALLKWKMSFLNQTSQNKLLKDWIYLPKSTDTNATNSSSNLKANGIPCNWTGISCNAAGSITRHQPWKCHHTRYVRELSFISFPNLEYLNLTLNKFFYVIPPQISSLSKLLRLDLSSNQFSGRIPPEIGLLGNLTFLYLHTNNLSDVIPSSIGNLKSLVSLSMSYNKLDGLIPALLGDLINITELYLGQNNLSVTIPKELGNLKSLVVLDLSINQLNGSIPKTLGNLTTLTTLYLHRNNLSGIIPKELGNLKSLVDLRLNTNKLRGSIQTTLSELTNFTTLHLQRNNLSGTIPKELGNLKSLVDLRLSVNNLSGSIPTTLGDLTNLTNLYLYSNNLSGAIPKELENLKSLVNLELNANKLSGRVPLELKSLNYLDYLDLSRNKFNDSIPSFIGEFLNLYYLNLSNNKFGQSLEILDISHNNLSGFIPTSMADMYGLTYVDVSYNHLEGPIPNIKAFQTASREALQGNKGLTGRTRKLYKATLSNADTVAVKKLHLLCPDDENFKKEFLNEIKALTEMRHQNIVKLYGFCSHRRHSFVVYEYLEKGSLATVLSNDEETKELGWSKRVTIVKGVAHALCYMHHDCLPPIVYRDISSKNILLDSEYEDCVSDFGTAKFLNPDSANWTALAGTYRYVAPGSSAASSSTALPVHPMLVVDVLDQRISPPTHQVPEEVL